MSGISATSDAALTDLVTWLASWSWPIEPDQIRSRCAVRGWELTWETPDGNAEWATGLIAHRPWATSTVLGGVVADLQILVASAGAERDSVSSRAIRDFFTATVRGLTETLGEPSTRHLGKDGAVTWLLPNGSELGLGCTVGLCDLTVTSPAVVRVVGRARS